MSTAFFAIENITLPSSNTQCAVYDVSGQGRFRESWSLFYKNVDGIFFVIDASDRERLSMVQDLILELINHPDLANRTIPFLILCNKLDKAPKMNKSKIKRLLHLDKMKLNSKLQWSIK
jgi:signal recognition particle receptor subunit beta